MTELLLIGVALLLVAACGGFVAAEFSLITVDRQKVDALAETGDRRAKGVSHALRTLSTQLSGAQLDSDVRLSSARVATVCCGNWRRVGAQGRCAFRHDASKASVICRSGQLEHGHRIPVCFRRSGSPCA